MKSFFLSLEPLEIDVLEIFSCCRVLFPLDDRFLGDFNILNPKLFGFLRVQPYVILWAQSPCQVLDVDLIFGLARCYKLLDWVLGQLYDWCRTGLLVSLVCSSSPLLIF